MQRQEWLDLQKQAFDHRVRSVNQQENQQLKIIGLLSELCEQIYQLRQELTVTVNINDAPAPRRKAAVLPGT